MSRESSEMAAAALGPRCATSTRQTLANSPQAGKCRSQREPLDPKNDRFKIPPLSDAQQNPWRCRSEGPEATRNLLFSSTFVKKTDSSLGSERQSIALF